MTITASVMRISRLSISAEIARQRADHYAQQHLHKHGGDADHDRDLPAVDGTRQDIPPDSVRAEGMRLGRRLQPVSGGGEIGVLLAQE
jgi:hypothetical protein